MRWADLKYLLQPRVLASLALVAVAAWLWLENRSLRGYLTEASTLLRACDVERGVMLAREEDRRTDEARRAAASKDVRPAIRKTQARATAQAAQVLAAPAPATADALRWLVADMAAVAADWNRRGAEHGTSARR